MTHDWPKLIAEIEASGMTIYRIAQFMGLQVVQVQRIKKTGRCQHHQGEQLIVIHEACCLQNVSITKEKNHS